MGESCVHWSYMSSGNQWAECPSFVDRRFSACSGSSGECAVLLTAFMGLFLDLTTFQYLAFGWDGIG